MYMDMDMGITATARARSHAHTTVPRRLCSQAGIVHAAEASLSQLLNLILAYLLLRGCGIGRSSAVSSMRIKFVSFVMVTLGLFLCTFETEPTPVTVKPVAGPGQAPTALINQAGQAVAPMIAAAAQRVVVRRRARRL